MKKSFFVKLLFIPALFVFFGCSKKDKIPAFLNISEFDLVANPNLSGAEGELTSKITEVWLYVDGNPLGVFELPARIPVLEEGTHKITMIPGIVNNGIASTKGRYLFLENFESNFDLVPNETIDITPFTFYKTGMSFIIEDFEGITNAFEEFSISPATISNSTNGAIYGNYCGRIELTEQDSIWNAKTNWDADLPKGREVYLEIDYAIESDVLISTEAGNGGGTNQSPYLELQKSKGTNIPWKKVYVTLEENVSFETNATFYNIILTSILPEGQTDATLLIDNVKLVYFP